MKQKLLLVVTVFVLSSFTIHAQQKTITGNVTSNDDGLPLPGVNVTVKGTSNGTQTDFDGNYTIQASDSDILVFSYLGFKRTERAVGTQTTINVALETDVSQLDEVIIVGFGTQSKRNLTDNIAKLTSKDISEIPTPSIQSNLAGKAAGVQVTQTNGKVESGVNIRIRGRSSIGASNEPLYVVDGIVINNANESNNGSAVNPLVTLSSNEIESIDILKDASAAAIYGSRGANGVVIITTKRGGEGRSNFSVNFSQGISEAANKRDWLNAAEYIELFTEAAQNSPFGDLSGPGSFLEGRFELYANGTDFRNGEVETDWQEIALRDGLITDADVSISGGTQKTSFFFSGAYNDTKGIVRGNELQRITARSNINHNFTDKLTAGMNISFSITEIDRIANDNSFLTPLQAIAQVPFSPAFNDDGSANQNTLYANFLAEAQNSFFLTNIRRVIGKAYASYQILPSLKFTSEFGYDLFSQTEDQFRGSNAPFQSTNGQSFASQVNRENYTVNNFVSFDKNFNDLHDLNVVVGTSFENGTRRFQSVTGTEFPTDDFKTVDSAAQITAGAGNETEFTFVSYFARATYTFNNKYLFKASVRRDGSSRFGANNRFGTFPAVSAGWVLSEENFLNQSNLFSFLKLRASWGRAGNAAIGNFASRGLFGGVSFNGRPGLAPTQAENADLTWEQSDQYDIAVEYGLFNGRISGEIDYYVKNTDGLLFNVPIPGTSGFQTVTRNIGELENKGVEFVINTKNIDTGDFQWDTSFNISQNRSDIRRLPNNGADIINGVTILREGEQLSSFFILEYAGVDPDNGDALFVRNTENPDGTIDRTTTNDPSQADRVIAGSPFPEWIGGITNSLRYKGIDLTFTFQGQYGADIFNGGGRFQSASADFFDNQSADQLRRWQQPGDITDVPQARLFGANGTANSTRYLQSADFVRLRNLTLGYTLPKNVLERTGLDRVRIYFSGFNLLTFTDYDGYDPESTGDTSGPGQAFYSAPAARTYSLGINFGF